MSKQSARLAALALLMFAASASPLTAKAAQQDTPFPAPDPGPPVVAQVISASSLNLNAAQQDTPFPAPDPGPPVVTQVI